MEIKQVYEFVNEAQKQALGEESVLNEDLSNIVDIGTAVFNANSYDKYVKALVDKVGKMIFVNRMYRGGAPSVMMDGWEYGSVLQKVSAGLLKATENETWDLEDGRSYDPNIFNAPTGVQAKFYNKYITFEVDISFTTEQIKSAFTSASQMNGFVSMLYTQVENTLTVKIDELIRRTINNMTASTLVNDYTTVSASNLSASSGIRAINLLYLYNTKMGTSLTKAKAIYDHEFIRFASYYMKLIHDRLATMSTVFNIGQQPRFTPSDDCHIILLSEFASAAGAYLQSDTFHNEFTKLPEAEKIAYWQGSGTNWDFSETSKIDVKTASGDTVSTDGILGVMYDRWALGVSNVDRRVTTQYNAKAEFYNNFYKFKAGYFNDMNENFVVFFIA